MKKLNILAVFLIGLVALTAVPTASANSFTLTMLPVSGNISGPAGSTIGWGYSITNQSNSLWLMLINLVADPFANGTANLLFDFPIVAPLSTVTVAYSSTGTGLYELTWDITAPVGFVNSGTFTASAEWWFGDPLNGGSFESLATEATAAYSATVTAPSTTPVPEPATWLLSLTGVLGLIALKKRAVLSI